MQNQAPRKYKIVPVFKQKYKIGHKNEKTKIEEQENQKMKIKNRGETSERERERETYLLLQFSQVKRATVGGCRPRESRSEKKREGERENKRVGERER